MAGSASSSTAPSQGNRSGLQPRQYDSRRSQPPMDRVVVTGGAGFIGSHLVEQLLELGATVLVVDDFRLGKREHLAQASPASRLTIIEGDIRSEEDLRRVTDFAPDAVFHMAALHFIPYCNAHPQEALDVNVLGLDALL